MTDKRQSPAEERDQMIRLLDAVARAQPGNWCMDNLGRLRYVDRVGPWRTAADDAMARTTAPDADGGDGWEATAAVLAHEVRAMQEAMRRLCAAITGAHP